MVNGNGAFSPSLVPVVWLPLELLPAPEGFLLGWGGDRCVSVVPFQVVFSKWRFFHLSFIFFIHTRFIGSQSEGPAVKLCSAQFGLLGTPEIWQMQLDRKKPQSMSCFSSKGGDSSSHFRNNTFYHKVSLLTDHITFLFLPIDGSTKSPVAGGLCGSNPRCLFRASFFKGCSFITLWKWRQFYVLYGLVLGKTFLFSYLKLVER